MKYDEIIYMYNKNQTPDKKKTMFFSFLPLGQAFDGNNKESKVITIFDVDYPIENSKMIEDIDNPDSFDPRGTMKGIQEFAIKLKTKTL